MNIGNGYSSWIHNTPQTGYQNRIAKNEKDNTVSKRNTENDTDVTNEPDEKKEKASAENMTYREQILAHMEEMAKKIKDGTVEPSFQTGAQSFTIKEWEKLLADFDDAEEGLQEQIKELIAEVEAQAQKEALRRKAECGTADSGGVTDVSVPGAEKAKEENATTVQVTDPEELAALLTDEVTKCNYPADDSKNKHWYITCYSQNGIMCKEAYMENGRWVNKDCWRLPFTEKGQYEKVMAFLQRFPQDANLRFAAHENFWKDFLAGEINEDDFVHFFETSTKDGVPEYTYEKDGSTYIDREKAKYAKYMNDFGAHFYTAEEMELIQRAVINENRKGLKKLTDYDGQMKLPENGKGAEKEAEEEDEDLKTRVITKPDGSTVLQIETNFGMMEVEITEAQKFGLQYNARPGSQYGSDLIHTAGVFTDFSQQPE